MVGDFENVASSVPVLFSFVCVGGYCLENSYTRSFVFMFSDCNGHLVIKWTFSDGNENIIIKRRRDVRAKLLFLSSNLLLF